MRNIESVIIENLIHNDEYARHTLPFLIPEYFHNVAEKEVFKEIKGFFTEYNTAPAQTILEVEFEHKKIGEGLYKDIKGVLSELEIPKGIDYDWLIDSTEKFCRDKAIHNAIMQSIRIIDGEDKEHTKESLPSLLQDAIAVSFDKSIGHDFYENAEERYEFFHAKENRVAFDLDMFNKITKGGVPSKTLNIVLAGTNVGKSLFLCHLASAYSKQGYDVLYITAEMAEEWIAQRIDCNILNVDVDNIGKISKEKFVSKLNDIQQKTHGKLVIKEYPTSSAHVGHFRALLEDLKTKRSFVPRVVIIDYMNICASQRAGKNDNSYTTVKKTAEELRALAQEYDVPLWTATQANRGGNNNSDVSITDTSESFGTPMSADFMFAIVRTEELDAMGQLMCIQLKSRYGNVADNRKFVIGVDINKFKLHNVEQHAQDDVDQGPAFDKSKFGERMNVNNHADLDFS